MFKYELENILSSSLTITVIWLAKTLTSREKSKTFRKPREALTTSRVLLESSRHTFCSSSSSEDTSMVSAHKDQTKQHFCFTVKDYKHLMILYNPCITTFSEEKELCFLMKLKASCLIVHQGNKPAKIAQK